MQDPYQPDPRRHLATAVKLLEIVGVPAAGFATAFAVATSLQGGDDPKPVTQARPAAAQRAAALVSDRAVELASATGGVRLSALPRVPALDAPVRHRVIRTRSPRSSTPVTNTVTPAATTTPSTSSSSSNSGATSPPAPAATAAPIQRTTAPVAPVRQTTTTRTPSYTGKSFDSSGSNSGGSGSGSGSGSFDSSG